MVWWKVETENKKSAEEIIIFNLGDKEIRYTTGYRWGSMFLESENKPVLDATNGINIFETEYEYDFDMLDDGWFSDIWFSDNITEEEKEHLKAMIEEDVFSIEEDGWINTDTECWFYGDLKITEA